MIYERTLKYTDKNGSKHFYVREACGRCGGNGIIGYYVPVNGGVCFDCNGSGVCERTEVEHTPEYIAEMEAKAARNAAIAEKRRITIAKKKIAEEYPEGCIYIVLGDSFSRREEIKAAGGRYNETHRWHFTREAACEGFRVYKVALSDAFFLMPDDETPDTSRPAHVEIVDPERSKSQHLFEVGDKVELTVKIVGDHGYRKENFYSRINTYILMTLYRFEDEAGNILTWHTSSTLSEETEGGTYYPTTGDTVTIKATVKGHGEYKGQKQTEITRVRLAKPKAEKPKRARKAKEN